MPRSSPHGLNGRSGPHVAVGYLRRSTDRQEQSIPDERKAIERYAAEHDLELARYFVDDAISGTSAVRRPAFQEMVGLAQPERRPFSYVIVYDVKRFGRLDIDEAGYYRHILRTHGVEVLYVGENFSGDATDDLLRPVKQWQAREESKDLAKVTIRGKPSRVESGYWNGGSPPFGYDLRYECLREDSGAFLFVLRVQADGSKLVLDESGKVVCTLARGQRMQASKRDRSRLVLSSPAISSGARAKVRRSAAPTSIGTDSPLLGG
jgi:DNA invertase Pin-like site-specific DNA recombinase